jgi:hypothetical protein
MARAGWPCKNAAAEIGCDVRKVGPRIWSHIDTWARLIEADWGRSERTRLQVMCELQGRPVPAVGLEGIWTPRDLEEALGRPRGTGRQTLVASRQVMARLFLADQIWTTTDLLEACERLRPMSEEEIQRRELMQRGRLERSQVFPRAR